MISYQALLQHLINFGEGHDDRTGVGTRSVFGYQWRHAMCDGFPLLTTKRVPFRWVAEELFWFLSGSTDEKDLRDRGVDIWAEWATAEQCAKFGRREGDLGPVYGALWRNFDGSRNRAGVDQIAQLFNDLETQPNSRRLIVSGWHAEDARKVALPPCHTLWQCKVHDDNSLSLHLYARSIDSFLGLPFNIASYALLLSLIAECTSRTPRDLVISFGDLHLYNNHVAQAYQQINRIPRVLPSLRFNPRLAGSGLSGLLSCQWSDLDLFGYNPHPKIEAEVAV